MRGARSVSGMVMAGVAMLFTAGAAGALTSGKAFYEAGKRAKPPYVFLSVSHGKVVTVRWAIHEGCDSTPSLDAFTREVQKLNAPIKHGRFSKTVHYTLGSSPVGISTGTTTIKGTISGTRATVKVSDEQDIVSYGQCRGAHTFKATRTNGFH